MAQLPTNWGDSRRFPEEWPLAEGIAQLRDRYGKLVEKLTEPIGRTLDAVIDTAEHLGATHVWFEWEYVDPDWRDEFAHFYATVYRSIPDRCERVHFARAEPYEYLGFVSMRPLLGSPISRTILAPPTSLIDALAARVPVRAHPWGRSETVSGFPYISQDRQLGRCAHANVWMVALYYHHRHHTRRVFLSQIAEAANGAPATGRTIPSGGLSVPQMSAALREAGLPAVHYNLDQLPLDETMLSVVCRYLNSGFPLLLITERAGSPFAHVTVLVGYGRDDEGKYFFIRHDDERGPYRKVKPLEVHDKGRVRWTDPEAGEWTQVLAPMPGKIYMTGESAEQLVRMILRAQVVVDYPELAYVLEGLEREPRTLRLRTYATEGWAYKREAGRRGFTRDRREPLVLRGMPRFVWVTEIQSIAKANETKDCVIGEFVVDATSNPLTAGILYGTLPGLQFQVAAYGEEIVYDEIKDDPLPSFRTNTRVHW